MSESRVIVWAIVSVCLVGQAQTAKPLQVTMEASMDSIYSAILVTPYDNWQNLQRVSAT